jgi:alpha-amylase/alpha-mannosidase (GH57 family)
VARAIQVFTEHFGVRPQGCWPGEGSVSEPALKVLEEFGFAWAASGEGVLRHSLAASGGDAHPPPASLHRAYSLPGRHLKCFFRHDALSDLIGFTYSKWHGDDAAANLVHQLEDLQRTLADDSDRVVAIILDGENAWEYYPFNAYFFLKAMYERLSEHPRIRLTTFSRCLAEGIAARELPRLVAGSWVYGNFSTWIGHAAKNRAWELLCEVKRAFDRVVVEGTLDERAQRDVERQLGVCEGSDWCWWFGDDNPAESVASFDALYRRHLANLYRMLGEPVPESLSVPLARGGGAAEHGGTMKRSSEVPV